MLSIIFINLFIKSYMHHNIEATTSKKVKFITQLNNAVKTLLRCVP